MISIRRTMAIQFFASTGATIANFILTLLLARMLTPAEIGIFSMTSVIVGFSHVFRDFGVSAFIRRAKVLTPEILRSAMGVLIASSWAIATILYLSSDSLAGFFHQAGVGQVMRVLALGFYFIPFGAIPQAMLARDMQADKQAVVTLITVPVYIGSSLLFAYNGFSYMSMAWANLINIIVSGLAYTILYPSGSIWRPSLRGWGQVVHFGVGAMLSSTVRAVDNAVPDLLLGKLSGPKNVGLFSRSNSTVNMFNMIVGPTINYMALPYLARTHHEGRDVAAEVARAIALLTGLIWSVLAVIASLAPDIIVFLYGPAWAECAPIVPLLCVACGVQATFSFIQPALTGMGRPYWSALPLTCGLIVKITAVLLFFDGNLHSFALIVAIAEIFSIPGYIFLGCKYINLPPWLIVKSVRVSLLIAATTFVCAKIVEYLLGGWQTPFVRLTMAMCCILPVWIAAVFLLQHPLCRELKLAYSTLLSMARTIRAK